MGAFQVCISQFIKGPGRETSSQVDFQGLTSKFRDPKLKESIDAYKAIPEYLENFSCSTRDMRKYIIGAIAELDMPKTNPVKALGAFASYITGIDNKFRQKVRDEILDTELSDIRALAPYIREILKTGAGCTIGNATLIDRDKDEFKTVENLF